MTVTCDYANPDNNDQVNYHFDADTMTVYPADHPAVMAFLQGGGVISPYVVPTPPAPVPVVDVAARLAALEAVLFASKPVTDANVDATQKTLTPDQIAVLNAPPK